MDRVSVIIPAWNRPALLREALSSIRAVEGPDLEFEIIVADNAGMDEVKAVASEFGAVYIRNAVPGVAATRNAGASVATGQYLMFLDEDDRWLPAHVRPHLKLLHADPDLGAVMGQIWHFDYVTEEPVGTPFPAGMDWKDDAFRTLLTNGLQIGALVIRASIWRAVGPFDRAFAPANTRIAVDDWDWYLRLTLVCRVGFVAVPCLQFRLRRPSPDEDTVLYDRQAYGRQIFWTNLRRAGPRRPPWLVSVCMWYAHDGALAGRLLTHAHRYAARRDYAAMRHALVLAARTSALHTVWKLACSQTLRQLIRQSIPKLKYSAVG